MLAVKRAEYIMDTLKTNKVVMVSDLSKETQVSEETIRRDLEKLEKKGVICRVHGGAYLIEGYGNETPITVREKIYQAEKAAIAKKCMEFINEKDSILLDCSTTAVYIAKELVKGGKKLTIITNSLSVASEAAGHETLRLILLGGELKQNTNSFCGNITIRSLEEYYADKVFISSAGVSLLAGISDYTSEEAAVRTKMIERAKSCYVVADLTKIGRSAVHVAAPLTKIDYLVTEQDISKKDKQLKEELERQKIIMITCE